MLTDDLLLTSGFVTYVHMEKGVLQADCFSPLMFNFIINTFIQFVKHEQYEQFGYKFIQIYEIFNFTLLVPIC